MPFIRGIVGKVRDSSRDTGAYDYERAVRGAERAEKSPRPVASSAQPRGE